MLTLTDYAVLACFALLCVAAWGSLAYWGVRSAQQHRALLALMSQLLQHIEVLKAESLYAHRQSGEVHSAVVALRLDATQQTSTVVKAVAGLREAVAQARAITGVGEV